MISKIRGLKKEQKITIMLIIAIFVVFIFSLSKNISQINKTKADISGLNMKNNIVILNRNSTKNTIIGKMGTSNIKVLSDNVEISESTIIKTNDILNYNNTNYLVAILGDPNKDGKVNISDLSKTYKMYKNNIEYTEVEKLAADTNEDGSINIGDFSRTYKIYKEIASVNNNYTVTFNANGGSSNSSVVKEHGSQLGTLPSVSRTGYTFTGWYTQASGGTQISSSTTVTGNVTYYAHWNANSYTVSFNSNGGSSVSSITKTYGSTLGTLSSPTKTCFTFAGWFTNPTSSGTQVSSSTQVTGNVTYYAHWNSKGKDIDGTYCCVCSDSSDIQLYNLTDGQYLIKNRTIQTGWVSVAGNWCYASSSGKVVSGWQTISGKTYYFNGCGGGVTAGMLKSQFIEGYWLTETGAWDNGPKSSWYLGKNGKYWYGYADQSWYAKSKSYLIDGNYYNFDSSGYCISGSGC